MTRYTPELENQVIQWLQERISSKLVAHVQRVADTATILAQRFAPDAVGLVRMAGLIHDTAKPFLDSELLQIAKDNHYPIREIEYQVPMLLHGAVGYMLTNRVFSFNDPHLQSACTYHTTGAPEMNTTDKIVFLADLIEPARDFPKVNKIRRTAERDLDAALLRATTYTLKYLIKEKRLVDVRLLELHNRLISNGVSYKKNDA